MAQDIAVRIHPQIPIPSSVSSAEIFSHVKRQKYFPELEIFCNSSVN